MSACRLDRRNARWMVVCAGFAGHAGLDVTPERVALVLLTCSAPWRRSLMG